MGRIEYTVETTWRGVAEQSLKLYMEWKHFHKEKNFETVGTTSSKLHMRKSRFIMRLHKVRDTKLWLGSSLYLQVFPSRYMSSVSEVTRMTYLKLIFEYVVSVYF